MVRQPGLSKRIAAAVSTAIAFAAGSLVLVPLVAVLYRRRRDLFSSFQRLPEEITVAVGGFSYLIDIQSWLVTARDAVAALAVDLASETPILALKAVLFTTLVYAMLWQPGAPGNAVYRTVPKPYHDVIRRLDKRTRSTLYAIYVLQAATAFGTFLVAWLLFALLGYNGAFALAVVAGVLQFVPVVGPSVVVLAIAASEAIALLVEAVELLAAEHGPAETP